MRKKKQNIQGDILFILISIFVVVVAWIGFNLYHIWATSTIEENVQAHLKPIKGNFDMQTLQQTKKRLHPQPLYEKAAESQILPTQTLHASSGATTKQTDTSEDKKTP